ncbi:MAG: hypothetical protein E6G60_19110, partial [Actinobacteria bacterium]
DLPGTDDLIEFETRVNYVVPKYDDPVICAYDLSKFGASTVMYALRTHPVVIIGGLLQENPFYVDPDSGCTLAPAWRDKCMSRQTPSSSACKRR